MTHKCLQCGREYPDGEEVFFSGCRECGGKKFVFMPAREKGGESQISEVVDSVGLDVGEGEKDVEDKDAEDRFEGERVESVRIISPGSYELNLDHLLEREEIVMALGEEGAYRIHLPSIFEKSRKRR